MNPRHADASAESLTGILKNIHQGQIEACYLIFGVEDYLVQDAAERITSAILPSRDRDFNFFLMDGDDDNLDHLCMSLMTPPLITGRKIIYIKNTRLFLSRKTAPELAAQIRFNVDREPERAARDFSAFLAVTGWQMDDLIDEGWEKITDEQWMDTVGETENAESRNSWLSKIVSFCLVNDIKFTSRRDQSDALDDVLSRGLPDGNHLIVTASAVDKRKKIFKSIVQKGKVLEFAKAKSDERRNHAIEAARERLSASGKKLMPGAWTVLGLKTGFDLHATLEAIDKLISFKADNGVITESDVDNIIGKIKEDDLFDFTGAFARKDLVGGLKTLNELLDRGTNHAQILSMIAREIRLLLHGKLYLTAGILKTFNRNMDYNSFQRSTFPGLKILAQAKNRTGGKHLASMHPYVVYNTLRSADRFTVEGLVNHLEDLASIDRAMKTTACDSKLLLERFLINFCRADGPDAQ